MEIKQIDLQKKVYQFTDLDSDIKIEQILDQLQQFDEFTLYLDQSFTKSAVIGRSLNCLSHLKSLTLILNRTILKWCGYQFLLKGLQYLQNLMEFSVIIQQNCFTSKEEYALLVKQIQQFRFLQSFTLFIEGDNFIGESDIELGKAIKQFRNLKKLDLNFQWKNDSNQNGLSCIYQGIHKIENLKFFSCQIQIPNKMNYPLQDLSTSLQNKILLKELILSIKYRQQQKEQLDLFNKTLSNLVSLENLTLNFQGSDQKCDTFQTIYEVLSNKCLKSLKINYEFELKECQDISLDKIQFNQLETFKLKITSQIGDNVIVKQSQILNCLINLQKLSIKLGTNNNFNDQSIIKLAQSLLSLKQLEELSFNIDKTNNLELNSIISILQAIQQLKNLQKLKLILGKNQSFSQICIKELNISLQNLPQLRQFNLCIYQYQQGDYSLANGIDSLKNLQGLKLNFETCLNDNPIEKKQQINSILDRINKIETLKSLQLNLNTYSNFYLSTTFDNLKYLCDLKIQTNNTDIMASNILKQIGLSFQSMNNLKQFSFINLNDFLNDVDSQLETFGQGLSYLTNLELIDLQINQIDFQGAQIISNGLSQIKKLKYCNLNLIECPFDWVFISAIPNNKNLTNQSMKINKNFQFKQILNDNSIVYYHNQQVQVITDNNNLLKSDCRLNYSIYAVIDNKSSINQIRSLSQGLYSYSNTLLVLNLNVQGQVGLEGSRDLGKCLSQLQVLVELYLDFQELQEFSQECLSKICLSFKNMNNLQKLKFNMERNYYEKSSLEIFLKAFKYLKTLKHLEFKPGFISTENNHLQEIGEMVIYLPNLEYLNLSFKIDLYLDSNYYKMISKKKGINKSLLGFNQLNKLINLTYLLISLQFYNRNQLFDLEFYDILKACSSLSKLQFIKINYQPQELNISSLNSYLSDLKKLKYLNLYIRLSNTSFKSVKYSIMRGLKYLALYHLK